MGLTLKPSAADLAQCVHCGLCLPNCPTYLQTGFEAESPRGRIHLLQALADGRVTADDDFQGHIERCLVCRNCESVCPSGVHFGRIMEAGRAGMYAQVQLTWRARLWRRVAFAELLPHRARLRGLFAALLVYQRTGLRRLVRASRALPARLKDAEQLLPDLERPFLPEVEVYPADGPRRFRVGLLTGCVMPYVYGDVHRATVRVLRRNGCEVHIPRDQACCGALNLHGGEQQVARTLARRNVRAFRGRGLDAIVVNSAGCGAAMKEYGELLDGPAAAELAARTRDITEFLAAIELQPFTHQVPRTVTLQDSCHLAHAQRITAAPRQLLAAVPGLRLQEMARPDLCCGSAGLYMLTEPALSTQILDERMTAVAHTAADTVVTANPGCMMQLQRGLQRAGISATVKHVVQLVDEAYGGARPDSI